MFSKSVIKDNNMKHKELVRLNNNEKRHLLAFASNNYYDELMNELFVIANVDNSGSNNISKSSLNVHIPRIVSNICFNKNENNIELAIAIVNCIHSNNKDSGLHQVALLSLIEEATTHGYYDEAIILYTKLRENKYELYKPTLQRLVKLVAYNGLIDNIKIILSLTSCSYDETLLLYTAEPLLMSGHTIDYSHYLNKFLAKLIEDDIKAVELGHYKENLNNENENEMNNPSRHRYQLHRLNRVCKAIILARARRSMSQTKASEEETKGMSRIIQSLLNYHNTISALYTSPNAAYNTFHFLLNILQDESDQSNEESNKFNMIMNQPKYEFTGFPYVVEDRHPFYISNAGSNNGVNADANNSQTTTDSNGFQINDLSLEISYMNRNATNTFLLFHTNLFPSYNDEIKHAKQLLSQHNNNMHGFVQSDMFSDLLKLALDNSDKNNISSPISGVIEDEEDEDDDDDDEDDDDDDEDDDDDDEDDDDDDEDDDDEDDDDEDDEDDEQEDSNNNEALEVVSDTDSITSVNGDTKEKNDVDFDEWEDIQIDLSNNFAGDEEFIKKHILKHFKTNKNKDDEILMQVSESEKENNVPLPVPPTVDQAIHNLKSVHTIFQRNIDSVSSDKLPITKVNAHSSSTPVNRWKPVYYTGFQDEISVDDPDDGDSGIGVNNKIITPAKTEEEKDKDL